LLKKSEEQPRRRDSLAATMKQARRSAGQLFLISRDSRGVCATTAETVSRRRYACWVVLGGPQLATDEMRGRIRTVRPWSCVREKVRRPPMNKRTPVRAGEVLSDPGAMTRASHLRFPEKYVGSVGSARRTVALAWHAGMRRVITLESSSRRAERPRWSFAATKAGRVFRGFAGPTIREEHFLCRDGRKPRCGVTRHEEVGEDGCRRGVKCADPLWCVKLVVQEMARRSTPRALHQAEFFPPIARHRVSVKKNGVLSAASGRFFEGLDRASRIGDAYTVIKRFAGGWHRGRLRDTKSPF